MHRLDPRISKLEEGAVSKAVYLFRWRQTEAEVLAERFPDGVPENANIIWITWRDTDGEPSRTH